MSGQNLDDIDATSRSKGRRRAFTGRKGLEAGSLMSDWEPVKVTGEPPIDFPASVIEADARRATGAERIELQEKARQLRERQR